MSVSTRSTDDSLEALEATAMALLHRVKEAKAERAREEAERIAREEIERRWCVLRRVFSGELRILRTTFQFEALMSLYHAQPENFTLRDNGHYSGSDSQTHVSIIVKRIGTRHDPVTKRNEATEMSETYHLYYVIGASKRNPIYTHLTAVDAEGKPFVVAVFFRPKSPVGGAGSA